MPTLDGVQEFLQVVESGSFSKASEKQGLSTAQMSRLVTQLEKKLGVRLLYRSTRSIALTEEGELYYSRCKQSLSLLENVEHEIGRKGYEASGTLKINLAGAFQEVFMVPILIDFMAQHPKLDVSVTFTDRNVNLIQDGYDVSVCQGDLPDSSVVAKRMASVRWCIAASKRYLAEHPAPETLEDLEQHNCLSGTDEHWELSREGGEFFRHPVQGSWRSDNAHAIVAAVGKDAGIGLVPVIGVMEQLRSGELVELLPQYTRYGYPVSVVYANRKHVPAKVRFFIDYMSQLFSQELFDEATRIHLTGL